MQLVVVVALILIGVLVWAIGDYSSKKSAEKEEKTGKIRDVTVPGAETKRPEPVQPKTAQESLDAQYARMHGLWVCPYCETLNERERRRCIACGAEKTE